MDGSVILWNIQTGEIQEQLFQESVEAIRKCAFSPNGSIIAAGDDSGHVCLWNQEKTLLASLQHHEEAIQALAFSHDSAIMMTGCSLGNVRLFSVEKGFERECAQ